MAKFSIICPTRNRVTNLIRFIGSVDQTISDRSKLEYMFYVDSDDTFTQHYLGALAKQDPRVRPIIGDRIIFSEMFNKIALQSTGDILFMTGDDIVMRTTDWDLIVEKEFSAVPDRLLVVSTRDGIQNEKIATHSFIGRPWVDTLGYLTLGIFPGDYVDNWLTDVARGVNRLIYKEEIYVEHLHPNIGKGQLDATYTDKFRQTAMHNTAVRYFTEEIQSLIRADVERLNNYIQSFEQTKENSL